MPSSGPPGSEGEIIKLPSTPVNVSRLSAALGGHPNRCFVSYLIDGLVHEFLAGLCDMPVESYECHNLQTAITEPAVVDSLLEKEVAKGFMIGPFVASPFSPYRVSPIGVATRKYSGKKRLIIDLSTPHDGVVPSINSLISREPFSLYYASVDNAISLITTAGRCAWLGKADITNAFKDHASPPFSVAFVRR